MKDADPLFQSSASMAVAPNYADWTFSLFRPLVRGDVLEVGCGIGIFSRLLAGVPEVRRLLSVDISPAAVAHCRDSVRDPRVEFREADIRMVAETFDLILCMNVLEHIEDDHAALQHMLRSLRPGGSLFLLVPAHQLLFSAFDVASGHYRRYDRSGMRALIGRAGSGLRLNVRQFYFNTIGALGYFVVYRLLRKPPQADASGEIGWFDRAIVPLQRRFERNGAPFGISLVSLITVETA